jgi:hypothetical protein
MIYYPCLGRRKGVVTWLQCESPRHGRRYDHLLLPPILTTNSQPSPRTGTQIHNNHQDLKPVLYDLSKYINPKPKPS